MCSRAGFQEPKRPAHASAEPQRLHRMRRLVAAQGAGEIVLDLLLGVAAVLFAELHADPRGALALCSFWGHPDDAARNRQLLFLAHQIEQHEDLVAEAIVAVGWNEQAAVFDEWHVGKIQGALVFDREGQQPRFVTWTSQFLPIPKSVMMSKLPFRATT